MITDPADDALRVATPILAFSTHPDFTTPQDVAVDDSGSVGCTTPINSGSSWIQERYRSLPSPSSHSQGEHRERGQDARGDEPTLVGRARCGMHQQRSCPRSREA